MKRLFLLALLLCALLVGGLFLASKLFINTDTLKQRLEESIAGATGTKAKVSGAVTFELFPSPVITFNDIQLPNIPGAASATILKVRSATAHISWTSLFSPTPHFKDLTLTSPEFELEMLGDGRKNWDMFTPSKKTGKTANNNFIPDVINIVDGSITYREQTEETTFSQINLSLSIPSWEGPFALNGKFVYRNEMISANADIGSFSQASKATLLLSSQSFEANFEGKTQGDNSLNISGILNMNVKNLGAFTGGIFPVYSLPTHITSSEPLSLTGAFQLSGTKFSAKELSIDSKSIKATAAISATLSPSALWDINAHVSLFDIDALTGSSAPSAGNLFSGPGAFSFSIPKETSLLFYLTADKIIYRKDNIINAVVDSEIVNKQIVIHTLEGTVPGKSNFVFTGAIENNGIRPLLNGELALSGTNFHKFVTWLYPQLNFIPQNQLGRFVFKSNISMMPTRIRASEIQGTIGDIGVGGEFEMRPEERLPSYRFNLNLDRLNLDTLNVPSSIGNAYEAFKKSLKDPFSNSFMSGLNAVYTIILSGHNLTLNTHHINAANLDVTLSPDTIDLRSLSMLSGDSDANFTYNSHFGKGTPTLAATLSSQALNTDIFFPPESLKGNKKWQWSENPLNFLNLDKFQGTIQAKIGYLKHHNLRLQNVQFDSSLNDGVITLKRCQAVLGGGPVIVKGQVSVGETPSFGISFGINGSEIAQVMNIFTDNVNMKGQLFAAGKATSFGKSPATLVNNTTGTVRISAKDVMANHIDLSTLIQKSPSLRSAIDLDELAKYSINNGSTLFNAVGGDITLGGGIASTKNLKMRTKYSIGAMAANLDLRSFLIKAIAKYRFAISKGNVLGITLKLDGPFTAPNKQLDTSEVDKYITDQAKRR